MDDFHKRALKSLRSRHEETIRASAKTIQDEIGYLLRDLDGERSTPGHYARRIAAAAQEIVTRNAALEAINDTTEILATADETAGA
jgi:hypothetical protein